MEQKAIKVFNKIMALVLSVSLAAYLVFVRPLPVAAASVSSLPADIDSSVDYDADYINFTVGSRTTVIDRHMKVYDADKIPYRFDTLDELKASVDSVGSDNFVSYLDKSNGGSVCFAVKGANGSWTYTLASYLPKSIEVQSAYGDCAASYWYSPSQDKIYIFTGEYYNGTVRAVKSYSKGTFLFTTSNKSCDLYVTCIDCRTGSVVYKLDRLSGCDYYDYSYSWSDRSGYPDDLFCIFANYSISGFYEPDTSKVLTPT